MSLGLAYWILMLVWVIASGALYFYKPGQGWNDAPSLIPFLLLLLLGWKVFGAPVQG